MGNSVEDFSEEEKRILEPFCTNLDKDVFVLTNLPEVVKGALFSRYSRSSKNLRRLLLDEFINDEKSGFKDIVSHAENAGYSQLVATQKAEEFYDRVLVGYGDDSVAELGGAHIACENVSNIASKVLEDSRIGISPLEKSTRYVYFDRKDSRGNYLYYRDRDLMESRHADEYIGACNALFDSYSKLIEPTKKWCIEKYPKGEESERAYNSTIRAKACDILRGFLPASTLTNVGLFGNGRGFEYLITKMYAHPLKEVRDIAEHVHLELMKVIPSFVKRARGKYGDPTIQFFSDTSLGMEKLADSIFRGMPVGRVEEVALVNYDANAEDKVVAAALYPYTQHPMTSIMEKTGKMSQAEKLNVIAEYQKRRQNRRHKPGRGFEYAYYSFDLVCNYASYRDLHRHRMQTQQRQDLGTGLGFDTPPELKEISARAENEFTQRMEEAGNAYHTIRSGLPKEAQYVVPFAYRIRWSAHLNLRELYHLVELRSAIQGHPDYRRIVLKMLGEVKKAHPSLVEWMKFADYTEFNGLERLEAEKKTDKKLRELERKHGG